MAKNRITDLRDHLFETLEALKDPDNPMALDRAHAICEVSQTIINSAKVEVDLYKVVSASAPTDGFFGVPAGTRELPQVVEKNRRLINGAA